MSSAKISENILLSPLHVAINKKEIRTRKKFYELSHFKLTSNSYL